MSAEQTLKASAPRPKNVFLSTKGIVLLLVLAGSLPIAIWSGDPYVLNILSYTYLFAGLACAWNLIGGYGGQFSLGHGAFFGMGAYVVASLYLNQSISPLITLIPAAVVTGLIGMLISWPTFRLKGPFFAIATMAINEVFFALANYFGDITGGPAGLSIPFKPAMQNLIFMERWKYALLMLGFLLFVLLVTYLYIRSRTGHYLVAMREDEDAAAAVGINVLWVKCSAMGVSAGLTAIGGGLFAMYIRVIDPPTVFTLADTGVKFALLALIGGAGTMLGPLVGAVLIVPLETYLRGLLGDYRPGMTLMVVGLVMIFAALYLKHGIVGAIKQYMEKRQ